MQETLVSQLVGLIHWLHQKWLLGVFAAKLDLIAVSNYMSVI